MLHRRLAHNDETLASCSEATIHLAVTDLMVRRFTGEAASPGTGRHLRIKRQLWDETSGENDLRASCRNL